MAAAVDPDGHSVHYFDATAGRGMVFDADRPTHHRITTDLLSLPSGKATIAAQYDGNSWRVAAIQPIGDAVILKRWHHTESGWLASTTSLSHHLGLAAVDVAADVTSVYDRAWPFTFVLLGRDGAVKGRHEEQSTEFKRWVAGTIIVMNDRFVQILADVESDSRVVRTFHADSIIASTRLNGPIGFIAVSPDSRTLLAIQNVGNYDAVLYQVTFPPSSLPPEVHP